MRRLILIICVLASMKSAIGQGAFPKDFDKVIPASPRAMEFKKYGDYPVDLSNGLAQISIPFHQVAVRGLSHNVDFSFHSAGIKVDDRDGLVGWGWSLNAGGMVSRVINGSPDESFNTAFPLKTESQLNPSQQTDYYFLEQCAKNQEGELDEYFFNVSGGLRGSFYILNINGSRQAKVYDRGSNIKVKCIPANWSQPLTGFEITDGNGIVYSFNGAREFVLYNGNSGGSIAPYISGWMLNKIEKPYANTFISFEYYDDTNDPNAEEQIYSPAHSSSFISWVDDPGHTSGPSPLATDYKDYPDAFNFYQYRTCRIKKISFPNGKIEFGYSVNTTNPFGARNTLKDVWLKGDSGEIYKHYHLNQASPVSSTRMKLENIEVKNNSGSTISQYSFDYYGEPSKILTYDFNRDYWGYPNRMDNQTSIPDNNATGMRSIISGWSYPYSSSAGTIFTASGGGANRAVNETAVINSGVIKQIIYPTGGKTSFEYESNRYFDNLNNVAKLAGGLRIKTIVNEDGSGKTEAKTYKYGQAESGYGIVPSSVSILQDPANRLSIKFVADGGDGGFKYFYSVSSNVFPEGKISSQVQYDAVAEYLGTSSNNAGKTISYYSVQDNSYYAGFEMYPGTFYKTVRKTIQDWDKGVLLASEIYASKAGGLYEMVSKEVNEYEIFNKESITGLKAYYVLGKIDNGVSIPPSGMPDFFYDRFLRNSINPILSAYSITFPFSFYTYSINCGAIKLKKSKNYTYSGGQTLLSEKVFEYANTDHLQPTKITTTGSDGRVIRTEIKYPQDISPATSATNGMITDNMVNIPLQSDKYINSSQLLEGASVAYKSWSPNGLLAPELFKEKGASGSEYVKARAFSYDLFGNLVEHAKENDIRRSYIWGYNSSFPTAEAINAKSNEIFFDGFEETGGWDANLGAYDNARVHSGRKSGKMIQPSNTYLVSHSQPMSISLSVPTKFKYSGWVYSNGPGTAMYILLKRAGETGYYTYFDAVTTNQTGKWMFLEKEYTMPADVVSVTLRLDVSSAGTVWWDDVRFHPSAAMMTTYTYDPLIGMTSQADVNNRYTFYEYDGVGRLSLIRDHDGNIIKKLCYKYNGQPESCPIVYGNETQTANFTRNNCTGGSIGGTVAYTINAGTYTANTQAAANQLAIDDLAANGQSYANTNASCLWGNQVQSANFTRSDCGTGYTGSSVTYTIAAGIYFATTQTAANQLATDAITTNGQAYANANGTCTPIPCVPECSYPTRKCINGSCLRGVVVYTSSVYDAGRGEYLCTFHYEYLDGSQTPDFTTYSPTSCL